MTKVAASIADAYCAYPQVGGIQVDLEPYGGAYIPGLNRLLKAIGEALRSSQHGCVTSQYPEGRSLSFFAFPDALHEGLQEALGPNGMIVVSGYDLWGGVFGGEGDKSMFNTVAQYKTKLQQEVDIIRNVAVRAGMPFSLAIPISASTHEYEKYTPGKYCGDICTQHVNTATMDQYLSTALDVVAQNEDIFQGNATSLYRGLSLWLWTGPEASAVEYPNHSGNDWYPANPSGTVLDVLKSRLPALS